MNTTNSIDFIIDKRQTVHNGIEGPSSTSQAQPDDVVSPYASVNYDKLHKTEHPYARLKSNSNENDLETLEEPIIR